MLMVNDVLNQTSTSLSVVLITWVTNPSHITNKFFCVRGDVYQGGGMCHLLVVMEFL